MNGFLLAMALQASGTVEEQERHVTEAVRLYHSCITDAALKMDQSGETASIIADAAVTSCRGFRSIALAFSTEWLAKKNPSVDYALAAKAASESLGESDAQFRQDAIAAVLTRRGTRK